MTPCPNERCEYFGRTDRVKRNGCGRRNPQRYLCQECGVQFGPYTTAGEYYGGKIKKKGSVNKPAGKERQCMKCRKMFAPAYPFNTICPRCRIRNEGVWMARGARR